MTTLADLNDKWAAYAGPGGWNGENLELCEYVDIKAQLFGPSSFILFTIIFYLGRSRYVGSWQWRHDLPGVSCSF